MEPQNFYNTQSNQTQNSKPKPPFSARLSDFIHKHRVLSLIIVLFMIFGLVGIVILAASSFFTPETKWVEGPEVAPIPYIKYQDRERFNGLLGDTLSTEILTEVNDIIVSNNEINSAPSPLEIPDGAVPVYTISIKEAPFTPPTGEKYLFMKFLVTVDDGREYTLWFRTDQDYAAEYVVVVLDRLDSKDTPDYVLEFVNEDDAIPSSITNWIDSLHLVDPQVETFPLPTVPHFSDYE